MMLFAALDPAGPEAHLWAFQVCEPKHFLLNQFGLELQHLPPTESRPPPLVYGLGCLRTTQLFPAPPTLKLPAHPPQVVTHLQQRFADLEVNCEQYVQLWGASRELPGRRSQRWWWRWAPVLSEWK